MYTGGWWSILGTDLALEQWTGHQPSLPGPGVLFMEAGILGSGGLECLLVLVSWPGPEVESRGNTTQFGLILE